MIVREKLAEKYIRGAGIEIGGRHCPLKVPAGVKVTYVDLETTEESAKAEPHLGVKHLDIVIDDAEGLDRFENNSLDFIIANHVLEHCHDTLGTLMVWAQRLKSGGIAYIALPDKEQSFDKPRPTTSLQHMIEDFDSNTFDGDVIHYTEWHYLIDGMRGKALEDRVALDISANTNIHFHVFDEAVMMMLFEFVEKSPQHLGLKIAEKMRNGSEVIWILRKS